MNTEELSKHIKNYLENDKTNSAIMLTGAWGSGKSYYVKNELVPYLEKDEKFANNISPVIRESWTTTQNRLYTVSDVLLLGGYWYNEEIFQKAQVLLIVKQHRGEYDLLLCVDVYNAV